MGGGASEVRILLAEDHPGVAASIARGLRRHGAAVDIAPDGGQALFLARVHPYDVVVLDRDLPEVHGDDVCRALNAEQPGTKVLMLTASRSTEDVVHGLSLGADDYLLKPSASFVVEGIGSVSRRRTGKITSPS
jgi:two-component system response regulator VanR